MATSEPFVELIEDEESYSNSVKKPSKKKKRCQLQKKYPFASLRVVGRCLHNKARYGICRLKDSSGSTFVAIFFQKNSADHYRSIISAEVQMAKT